MSIVCVAINGNFKGLSHPFNYSLMFDKIEQNFGNFVAGIREPSMTLIEEFSGQKHMKT